jgi:N-acetylmuramic acid 6-phosphate etherase
MVNTTEDLNPFTSNIPEWNDEDIVSFIHTIDIQAYEAVGNQIKNITLACKMATEAIEKGGRVIYIGAGTSGRIGAQDVVELLPTYDLGHEFFDFILAGGDRALLRSVEGAEDEKEGSIEELQKRNLNSKDLIIGITASGTTPFVIGAMEYALSLGCNTIGLTNNYGKIIKTYSTICIELLTGSEVIQGSTRMKAATAQKMTLNILSTTIAIKLGRTYGNTMSHMGSWYNDKLKRRSVSILVNNFALTEKEAEDLLKKNEYNINRCINELQSKDAEQ